MLGIFEPECRVPGLRQSAAALLRQIAWAGLSGRVTAEALPRCFGGVRRAGSEHLTVQEPAYPLGEQRGWRGVASPPPSTPPNARASAESRTGRRDAITPRSSAGRSGWLHVWVLSMAQATASRRSATERSAQARPWRRPRQRPSSFYGHHVGFLGAWKARSALPSSQHLRAAPASSCSSPLLGRSCLPWHPSSDGACSTSG